jgi:hypothetical protein
MERPAGRDHHVQQHFGSIAGRPRPIPRGARALASHGASNRGDALALGARLLGYGTSGDAVRRLTPQAGQTEPYDVEDAPFFIPHISAERGSLWLDGSRTALIGVLPTPTHAARPEAWLRAPSSPPDSSLRPCTAGRLAAHTPGS